jgi:hypothetical protein
MSTKGLQLVITVNRQDRQTLVPCAGKMLFGVRRKQKDRFAFLADVQFVQLARIAKVRREHDKDSHQDDSLLLLTRGISWLMLQCMQVPQIVSSPFSQNTGITL